MADVAEVDGGNQVLESLLTRRSTHKLKAPAPSSEELEIILRAGCRAPDFGGLRPYRFLVVEGDGLSRLGSAIQRAALAAGKSPEVVARAPKMPMRAPLIIIVVAKPKPNPIVPPLDQLLCAGCTVLMMQLAARSLGYGGVWRSGWMMHDRGFHRELGLGEEEQIIGFLYLGTKVEPKEPVPPIVELSALIDRL